MELEKNVLNIRCHCRWRVIIRDEKNKTKQKFLGNSLQAVVRLNAFPAVIRFFKRQHCTRRFKIYAELIWWIFSITKCIQHSVMPDDSHKLPQSLYTNWKIYTYIIHKNTCLYSGFPVLRQLFNNTVPETSAIHISSTLEIKTKYYS